MKTILVPSDFSKNANTALRYAIRLGRLLNYKVVVFHCTRQTPYTLIAAKNEEEMELMVRKDEEEKRRQLKKTVDAAYKYLGYSATPSSTKVLVQFNPIFIEKTIEVAKYFKADLIVMGTHGASGLNKFFFGSNTAVMIAKSPVPLLAIPEKYKYRNVKKILFSSDLENFKNELNRVLQFAKPLNAAIEILHIDYGIDYKNKKTAEAETSIKQSRYQKIKLVKQKATDKPLLRQIREYIVIHNQEWVVMFTKERSFRNKLITGSKTSDLSMALPVPLLSLKK